MKDFYEECELFAGIGDFTVKSYVVDIYGDSNKLIAFEFRLTSRIGSGFDSLVYADYTTENIRATKALFPEFDW